MSLYENTQNSRDLHHFSAINGFKKNFPLIVISIKKVIWANFFCKRFMVKKRWKVLKIWVFPIHLDVIIRDYSKFTWNSSLIQCYSLLSWSNAPYHSRAPPKLVRNVHNQSAVHSWLSTLDGLSVIELTHSFQVQKKPIHTNN